MADTKVSALPAVTSLAGSDAIMAVASGSSRKITKTNLATALNAGVSAITNGDATVFGSTTASGTGVVTLSIVAGGVPIAKGGTGATSASSARTNLGLTDNAIKVHNFAASAVPTVSDDSGDGYSVGSIWVVTSGLNLGDVFIATSVSIGAAVWSPLFSNTPNYSIVGVNTSMSSATPTYEATNSGITLTLPTAIGLIGFTFTMINSSIGNITIATTSSQTIGNASGSPTSVTLAAEEVLTVISNGTNWRII